MDESTGEETVPRKRFCKLNSRYSDSIVMSSVGQRSDRSDHTNNLNSLKKEMTSLYMIAVMLVLGLGLGLDPALRPESSGLGLGLGLEGTGLGLGLGLEGPGLGLGLEGSGLVNIKDFCSLDGSGADTSLTNENK